MEISYTQDTLNKFSKDRSIHQVFPQKVCFPKSETELIDLILYAKKNNLSITPRGGGTGLSGAALGNGIIVDFTKHMNHSFPINNNQIIVQPGILIEDLRPLIEQEGHILPSVPLQGKCAIGGNINTRSIGPKTLHYGPIENQVKSIRGILSSGEVLDTFVEIPKRIRYELFRLKQEILSDQKLTDHILKRPIFGGGYQLRSLIQETDIQKIVKNLLIGSTGTLILMSQITLELPTQPTSEQIEIIYLENLYQVQKVLNMALETKPFLLEFADRKTFSKWSIPSQTSDANYLIILGYNKEEYLKDISKYCIQRKIVHSHEQENLWIQRKKTLPLLEEEAQSKNKNLPDGLDDLTFSPQYFFEIMNEIDMYLQKQNIEYACYGHLGVGCLHLRPFMNLEIEKLLIDQTINEIFNIVKKYHGTLVGEHNAGILKSKYLEMESPQMFQCMQKLKKIFDPFEILNPTIYSPTS